MSKLFALFLLLFISLVAPVRADQEVVLRYALTGRAQDTLGSLVQRFNDAQHGAARVLLQNRQGMNENAQRQLPHMALLDTDDSMAFFLSRPHFKPLYKVMQESGESFDTRRFFTLISAAVDDDRHRMQALPMGLSLPVLMWNKAAFRKAGLDPDLPPKTWQDVQERAASLHKAGVMCPLTSSRFAWIHLENLSAQHDTPILVHQKNGTVQVELNQLVDIKHIALLASWQKSFYFQYFGPATEANQKFLSGECAMITGESSLYDDAVRSGLVIGTADLPYYDDLRDITPDRLLPGGAALWVLDGHNREEDRVIAKFVSFLLRPDVQLDWLHGTTFLPMTSAVFSPLKTAEAAPVLTESLRRRLSRNSPVRAKHGAGLDRLHDIINEEIATVWANTKPVKEALDTAMFRANSGNVPATMLARLPEQFPVVITGVP
jgi:sn-glycerol 3-phosphate transport system substrate-binding protein